MNTLGKLYMGVHGLVIFRHLMDDPVLDALSTLLAGNEKTVAERVRRYSAFVAMLYEETDNLTEYLLDRILEDENIYVCKLAQGQPVAGELEECLIQELKTLQALSGLTTKEVRASIAYDGYLPGWRNSPVDMAIAYRERMAHIATRGYGIFSKYHMYTVKGGAIIPTRWPDPIRLSELAGYETERQAVIDNTLALLKGRPSANTLLYGDAGTGKSSTVKAIVNEYRDRGLRLIEITKKQFGDIPMIAEQLSKNPLKFILFIDDLSFTQENDDFNALKAILEGSVSHRSPNLAIYATSNRRHLIKESFSDRAGDDIHRNETIQELCSLSDRFGLSVSFFAPDKVLYRAIVSELRAQYGVQMDDDTVALEAERYAMQRGGRSPRVARQFMEYLVSREG